MRVLIAAEEAAARQQLEDFFLGRQHETTACAQIQLARQALAEGAYSIVVVDLEPDREAALELCREIRGLPRGQRAFVLAVTGAESAEAVRPALEAGADDYLARPIRAAALALRFAVGQRALSARRDAEESQRCREEYYRVLLESVSDLLSILDLDGRVLYQSRSSSRLLGRDADALVGRHFHDLLHEEDRQGFADTLQQSLQDADAAASIQVRLRHRDGGWRHFESLCRSLIQHPVVGGLLVTCRDVSERRRVEAALERERALFQQLFRNSPAGIVILDADDRVVDANRAFVDLFRLDAGELEGRPLSDLIVPEKLKGEAAQLSQRVFGRRTVQHETVRRRHDGSAVEVSILGCPIELGEGRTGALGLYTDISVRKRADADVAMYRAKTRGKGCCEIFDEEMQRGAVERRLLESKLAYAIEAEQQILYYQPIFSLATGRIVAFEALVRWRHPERGLLGPAELIPACEATGLILPLGRWILERAFSQAVAWQRRFSRREGWRLSVNLSEEQLAAPDFFADLDRLTAKTRMRPETVAFELREGLLVDAPESIPLLWQLRKRGFRLHLDRFGTGTTSLRELYRSPVEALKIDRSFIARMKPGGEDAEIVRAASALGVGLGLSVVAEGIETASQLESARRLGPTHAQGYLFSRPLPEEEATALIAEDPKY